MIMKKVVLDAGHGGYDPGAIGPNGLRESDMALDVVLRMRDLLLPYVDVVLTRDDDMFLTLSERPAVANEEVADAFVSYHFNAGSSQNTALSFEVFSTRGQNNSDKLASAVIERQLANSPNQKLRADMSDGDKDKEANFTVILKTYCPSILIEGEFIHTVHGEAAIKDRKFRQMLAESASEGLLDFLEVEHPTPLTTSTRPPESRPEANLCPHCGQSLP